jgi:hypothetical protein
MEKRRKARIDTGLIIKDLVTYDYYICALKQKGQAIKTCPRFLKRWPK